MNLKTTLLGIVKMLASLAPTSHSGTTKQTGAAIDRLGFGSMVLGVNNAAASGSPSAATLTPTISHCDTSGGSYEDVTLDDPMEVIDVSSAGFTQYHIDLSGFKRYVKVGTTPAFTGGSTPACVADQTVVLGDPDVAPPVASLPVRGKA